MSPLLTSAPNNLASDKIIFIVGNSRSGTTMLRRVLGNHPEIYMLEELHFFEQLWSTADKNRKISISEATELASKLLFIQRSGYLSSMDTNMYKAEAARVVKSIHGDIYPHQVLKEFVFYETARHDKTIPCEKTPQDVFYIGEIIELFPSAKIINIVRDPRGVLLSQKRKWQRRNMGAKFMTKKEQRRLKINYHPITISRLWNSSTRAASRYKSDPHLHTVNFENLVTDGENEVRKICNFLEIEFNDKMLMIPHLGSSNEADKPEVLGIKTERAGNWEHGGLNRGEVWLCQKICNENMEQHGYEVKKINPGIFYPVYYSVSFPVKLALALLFNLHRTKNIVEAVKRRLK